MRMFTAPSLARRIVLSVMLGLGLILTIFGLVASYTVSEMAQATYRERLILARTIAGHIDDVLRYSMGELTRTAASLSLDESGTFTEDQTKLLRRTQDGLGAFAVVSVADKAGTAIWVDPPGATLGTSLLNHPAVLTALDSGKPSASEISPASETDGPQACLGTPLRDTHGRVAGVLMAEVDPRHAALSLLPTSAVDSIEKEARISLVDAEGRFVAGDPSGASDDFAVHTLLLRRYMQAAEPGVVVHTPRSGEAGHLVAYAPVPSLPAWGVVVEQPGDIALAALRDLQRRLLLAGAVALLSAIAFALLDARRVTKPLKKLAAVAERFAVGNLDEQVTVQRNDEVGVLARALESMRTQLKRSLDEIEANNRELEARVQLRTMEAEERNRQLATTNAIAATVSGSLKTEEILAGALRRVLDVTGLEDGRFVLLDERAPQRSFLSEGAPPPTTGLCSDDCLCARAVQIVAPVAARDISMEPAAVMCRDLGLRSLVVVPLSAQKQVLGVLILGSKTERFFEQRDLDTFGAVGQQIGMALANAQLYEEVEKRERARVQLLERIITVQEDERKRIARDLHDSTGQSLSAIVMGMESIEEIDPWVPDQVSLRVARLKDLASNAIAELRELVFDLRPIALDELGLVPALRAYAERHLGEHGVDVSFETLGMKDRLPGQLETSLYRILQETINNVAKHARPSSVRIRLACVNGDFAVDVEDDGIGFDPAIVGPPTRTREGVGLLGMKERVEMLGGSLRVESARGHGTKIHIQLSLAKVEGGTT